MTGEELRKKLNEQTVEDLALMVKEAEKIDNCMASLQPVIAMALEVYGPHALCGALCLMTGGIASTAPQKETKEQLIRLFVASVRNGTESLLANRLAVIELAMEASREIDNRATQKAAVDQ